MFIIYDRETTQTVKDKYGYTRRFDTLKSARWNRTRLMNKSSKELDLAITFEDVFRMVIEKKETVKSLMSGKLVVQGVNTPLCCDPSSETYWSM